MGSRLNGVDTEAKWTLLQWDRDSKRIVCHGIELVAEEKKMLNGLILVGQRG